MKNRLSNTLQENISKFQNGGMKGKGVVDDLFIIRGIINHAKYLGKELWLTFYDVEKCFDSLWLIQVGRKLVLLQVIVCWRLFSMKSEYLSQQKNVRYGSKK